jgi:hypothetical protein
MNDLPNWALSIIAVAVGLTPGLALLSARLIARLLHRVLWAAPGSSASDRAGAGTPRTGRRCSGSARMRWRALHSNTDWGGP